MVLSIFMLFDISIKIRHMFKSMIENKLTIMLMSVLIIRSKYIIFSEEEEDIIFSFK